MISTNVLARGIDIPAVDVVINYDIPMVSEAGYFEPDYANYIHRVGRTGRFSTDGMALTFWNNEVEESMVGNIQKYWELEMQEIKEFNEFKGIFKEMRPFLS